LKSLRDNSNSSKMAHFDTFQKLSAALSFILLQLKCSPALSLNFY
jgi:hypothetical protein